MNFWMKLTLPQAVVLSVATIVAGAILAFVPEGNVKLAAAGGFITTVLGVFAPTKGDVQ